MSQISFHRQSDEDFLDELLGGVGGQIASLIPQDVDSQVLDKLFLLFIAIM